MPQELQEPCFWVQVGGVCTAVIGIRPGSADFPPQCREARGGIAQSIEGLTAGMTDDIQTMPIGMAMVVGAGIESPLLVEVRPRESRHGGTGINVLGESD